jgi:hypothetical protein
MYCTYIRACVARGPQGGMPASTYKFQRPNSTFEGSFVASALACEGWFSKESRDLTASSSFKHQLAHSCVCAYTCSNLLYICQPLLTSRSDLSKTTLHKRGCLLRSFPQMWNSVSGICICWLALPLGVCGPHRLFYMYSTLYNITVHYKTAE